MELKQQVCSIELAKRLRELGVKQESLFWHWATDVEEDGLTWWTVADKEPRRGKRVRELSTPQHYRGKISAYTAAELGAMLPGHVIKGGKAYLLHITRVEPQYAVWYQGDDVAYIGTPAGGGISADTEADARAKMLIYLLENKLLQLSIQPTVANMTHTVQ